MQNYELMAILDPALEAEATDQVVAKVNGLIEKEGGKVQKTDKWGRKKLAYEIKHKNEGFYVLWEFDAKPESIEEIRRVLSISDEVMRARIVRTPAKKQQ